MYFLLSTGVTCGQRFTPTSFFKKNRNNRDESSGGLRDAGRAGQIKSYFEVFLRQMGNYLTKTLGIRSNTAE
ncbi:hypothetical protein SAMN05443144_10783 [Fodinibius roseus]|uniref:Uncharacterized protein n=1 Tax=Fodinibius roseus TaxID=1194090 RepID=A0A1M5AIU3_9BACT|nr:hypothetical protein SAMN05443144_10783 [Fodinibius roseus]